MRVLHVIYKLDPEGGGPPRALLGLASAQKQAGLDVRVLAAYRRHADMRIREELVSRGVPVQLVGPTIGPLQWHRSNARAADLACRGVDIVHIHAIWEDLLHHAARAARSLRVPYIVRPCGMLDPWSLSQRSLRKRLYLAWRLRRSLDTAAALHFTTETERELTDVLSLKAASIVEPNGVELHEFVEPPAPGTFRRAFPQIGSRPIVLFLSRLHPKKGVDLLVAAFARANTADAVLVLAGPDPVGYRRRVEALVKQHGLDKDVIFTGMVHGRDRVAAMVDADLFVLPSYQENFGVAVVEALATGTPVIVSDQVNICHEIDGAECGAVVPLDVDALALALSKWMSDARCRIQASQRATELVAAHYDWNQIARRWCVHYERLVGRRHR